ncbi:hypothetical protein TIFTF001_051482 [Ficus carica]|uniref:Uncharacterized protein n=1 Tax=Ficus carica TaxID=3494 RepID=A0AA87YYN4_FICCA|nr:hypothetical protein TIFTF001_051482 [Ficus carica]
MVGDWSCYNADEREVKAFWANRELQWNEAGDSCHRSCGSHRWSAHQRTCSPPPPHGYPHSPTFVFFTDPQPSLFSISTISIFLADPPPLLPFISTTSIFPKEPPPP